MLDERPRILLIDDGEAYAQAIVEQMSEFCLVDPGGDTPGRASDGPAALSFLDARADDVDVVLDGRRNLERKRRTGRRHRSVEKKWKENTVFHATTLGRERDIAVVR